MFNIEVMILIVVILTIVCSAFAGPLNLQNPDWLNFKKTYGKTYSSVEEEQFHLDIYEFNQKAITEHNAKYETGEVTYFLRENQLADLTHTEVLRMITGTKKHNLSKGLKGKNLYQLYQKKNSTIAKSIDWRDYGAVTPVKNQIDPQYCGSCWAFATVAGIESHQFLTKGKLVSLSEQNLVDCAVLTKNHGCNGGVTDFAYDYIIINGGVDTEESYPYEARDAKCRFNPKTIGGKVKSYVVLPAGSQEALLETLSNVGPVVASMDFSLPSLGTYGGGIFNDPACKTDMAGNNHDVIVVGYGSDPEGDYWLIKNSLGVQWGIDGYLKLARNGNNTCGIISHNLYPIVA